MLAASPWTADEIALLGTAPDATIAKEVKRSVAAVGVKRRALGIEAFNPEDALVGADAAEYADVCASTISRWYASELLTPTRPGERPRRCTKDALDRAKAESARRSAEHRSSQFSKNILNGKRANNKPPRGFWGARRIADEAKRRGIALTTTTVRTHFRLGKWLKHAGPEDTKCYYCRPKEAKQYLDSLPKLRSDASDAGKNKWRAVVRLRAEQGGLSTSKASSRANVSIDTVSRAVKGGDLKPVGGLKKRPWRFTERAVDEWATRHLARQPCDVPLREIPSRVPNDPRKPGEILKRVYSSVDRNIVKPYWRRCTTAAGHKRSMLCVHEDQVCKLVRDITRTLRFDDLIGDRRLPEGKSDFDLRSVVRQFGIKRSTVRDRLKRLAPKAGRKIPRPGRGTPEVWVYPRAAIESALRGEQWTPPAANAVEPAADDTRDTPDEDQKQANGPPGPAAGGEGEGKSDGVAKRRTESERIAQRIAQSGKPSKKKPAHVWDAMAEAAAAEFKRRYDACQKKGVRLSLWEFCEEYAPTVKVPMRTLHSKLTAHRSRWDPLNQCGGRPRKPR